VVYVRETVDSREVKHHLLKSAAKDITFQPRAALKPPGLDAARQTYLYRHIRDYVEDPWKDTMCPLPGTVFPLSYFCPSAPEACHSDALSSDSEVYTPIKRGTGRGRSSRGRRRGGVVTAATVNEPTSQRRARGRGRRRARCVNKVQ